jgi:hypothetical protein
MPGPLPAKRLACATIGPPIASTVADSPAPHAARDGRLVMHNLTSLSLRPARWRVLRLIWPFVAIVLLLLALGTASLQVIRGVRAYISAESVW